MKFLSTLFVMTALAINSRADLPKSDANRLADAICKAEGGAATRHPYGILTKYRHTTPRQACINTINHAHRDWVKAGKPGDYLVFLANRYAPVGAKNDPTGLNRNWLRNVKYYYENNH